MEKPGVPVAEIGLLIYPDCQLAAVHGLTDLFRIANESTERIEALETADIAPPFMRVSHWRADEDEGKVSCVYDSHPGLPHRLSHVIAPPSIISPKNMRPMPAAAAWMSERHAQGSTLCSVCAGAFVLAETGLIDGRRATTHWAFASELAARFPTIELAAENLVVDEGDIMTAGGILAWTDLGLTLVERLLGPSVMLATARFLLIDPPRRSQRPFGEFVPRLDHSDEAVRRAQHRIHADGGKGASVAELAASAGLTERTFLRRFVKATGLRPIDYVQEVRIAKAREALELTRQPVDRIAWQVGYSDPAAFRKTFQRITGLTPATFRQRFGIAVR
ncbi:GlxA family transcriptional regulator [Aureimonas mangrovi]|uniref:GlxA family transcriptional regulator n=1 Tax=Aureimonas mangrovi TaxID=2758041 RepID=UPI00163D6055|nr:GlxA family transcriptional regulator [Aureimonas mangrovi]